MDVEARSRGARKLSDNTAHLKGKAKPSYVADELPCQEGLAGTKAMMHKQHLHGRVIKWKRNE